MTGFVTPGFWDESELDRELDVILAGEGPVVVGPWLSELGFELLYWIPFVTAICRRREVDPRRLVVLSRGGVESWYGAVASRYVEIFDHCTAAEFRLAGEGRSARQAGSQKQFHVDDFDFRLLERAGLAGLPLLHPRLLYRTLHPYLAGHRSQGFLLGQLVFTPFEAPSHPVLDALPPSFTAVKFYTRSSFKADGENRAAVETYVRRLAAKQPVVVLDQPYAVDDHGHFGIPEGDNIHHLGEAMTLRDNLAVQTAVLARATGFTGTYGGLCYLPMRLGKPAVGVIAGSDTVIGVHAAAMFAMMESLGGGLSLLQAEAFRDFATL